MSSDGGHPMFQGTGDAYDFFMGRYSRPLAVAFADLVGVDRGMTALDVGCGAGALTGVLADRLGDAAVCACDPSPSLVAACATRHPGVDVRSGRGEALPFDDRTFDVVLAQLVLHFVEEPERAASEMRRVARPGGLVGACVWDFADGMEMLRLFWDAACAVEPDAPDEAQVRRFGRKGEIAELFEDAGLHDVRETTLAVSSTYESVDELWAGYLAGIGPAGAFLVSLPPDRRAAVRRELEARLPAPDGPITLGAVARTVTARTSA